MLSNNGLCLHAAAQYMLLFLVLVVNSDWFQIVRSWLSILMRSWYHAIYRNVHVNLIPHNHVHDDVIFCNKRRHHHALLHKSIVIFLTMELSFTEENCSCSYQRTSANCICTINKGIQYVHLRLGHLSKFTVPFHLRPAALNAIIVFQTLTHPLLKA